MKKRLNLVRRLIAWLSARDAIGASPQPADWADLPAHHPDCATCP